MQAIVESTVLVWSVSVGTVGVVELMVVVTVLKGRLVVDLLGAVTWSHHGEYLGEALSILQDTHKNFI